MILYTELYSFLKTKNAEVLKDTEQRKQAMAHA